MEKTLMKLSMASWLSVPLGLIMYFGTADAFGDEIAIPLGIIAATAFILILRKSSDQIISEMIAKEIREAIHRFGQIENYIEIKKANRTGIIARIYLINAGAKVSEINQAVKNRLESSVFKGRIWILQMTDIGSREELNETRQVLDRQLLEELRKIAKEKKDK
ncbi:MAG: hypothetical protein MR328_03515 [Firmicutes bacterium]|nr:hypothetical protein [Bacillota bacterium]